MPLVSVLMPVLNQEQFIGESIGSVLSQDFKDLELIIIDDGSTDATSQIIERHAERDTRIRVIRHEHNLDKAKSYNDGIEAAKGRFIAQIDSDDVWMPDKLTKQLTVLERDEDLIVWSEGDVVDHAGRSMGRTFSERIGTASIKKSGDLWLEFLRWGKLINNSTVIYNKRSLGGVRYDEGLRAAFDFRFFLELARQHRFYFTAESLAKIRIHDKNLFMGDNRTPKQLERARINSKEYCSIVEDEMRLHGNEIAPEIQAALYHQMGLLYESLAEYKKSVRCFLRAIKCNPRDRATVRDALRAFTWPLRRRVRTREKTN